MKTIQAELWNNITSHLGDVGVYEEYNTPRASEAERLYENMCNKFIETLAGNQRAAFEALLDIFESIRWSQQEIGVAMGIHVAAEIQKILAYPSKALQHASMFYTPVIEVEEINIQALNEYFDNYNKGGGGH